MFNLYVLSFLLRNCFFSFFGSMEELQLETGLSFVMNGATPGLPAALKDGAISEHELVRQGNPTSEWANSGLNQMIRHSISIVIPGSIFSDAFSNRLTCPKGAHRAPKNR